jgi:hypothetical protein
MGHAQGADRLLIRPASGRQTGAELLERTAQSKGIETSQPFGRVTHKQHRHEPGNGPRRNRPRLSQPLVCGL